MLTMDDKSRRVGDPRVPWPLRHLITVMRKHDLTNILRIVDIFDNFLHLTIFDKCRFFITILDKFRQFRTILTIIDNFDNFDNFYNLGQFWTILTNFDNFDKLRQVFEIFRQIWQVWQMWTILTWSPMSGTVFIRYTQYFHDISNDAIYRDKNAVFQVSSMVLV